MNVLQKKDIEQIVGKWDFDTSMTRSSEEAQELALALLHFRRDKISVQELHEEMADVKIAIYHLETKIGSCDYLIDEKIAKGLNA